MNGTRAAMATIKHGMRFSMNGTRADMATIKHGMRF
jgi:hypothetical protein